MSLLSLFIIIFNRYYSLLIKVQWGKSPTKYYLEESTFHNIYVIWRRAISTNNSTVKIILHDQKLLKLKTWLRNRIFTIKNVQLSLCNIKELKQTFQSENPLFYDEHFFLTFTKRSLCKHIRYTINIKYLW